MNAAKVFGYLLMSGSVAGAVFYFLWWSGAVPFLHRDDAVRLTALFITLALFLVVGFLGYVTVSTKPPKPIERNQ